MRLKRLIVHGFKSFADRTEFDFEHGGLTCIVGPNGCGKSNVLDAVKWVLGEQRPTSLRGKEMTDVIFNGTVRRPPMGLCEASLLFDNKSRTLALDEDDVQITRRVLRTGETDYLVNGRGVRLRDVRDLLAGTGLGPGGYGFLEQGKIDSVLASNPLDRRRVFEEAAGISRFRARKHETELKLHKVEENLSRLADVIEEINRQVRSLKIHAGKARNHAALSERLRRLQRRWTVHRVRTLKDEQEALTDRLTQLSGKKEHLARERDALKESLHTVEAELSGLVEGVSSARTRFAEVNGRAEAARQKIDFETRYLNETTSRKDAKVSEIAEQSKSLAELKSEQVLLVRETEQLQRDAVQVTGRRGLEEEQVSAVRGRGLELQAARANAESRLRQIDQRASEIAKKEARIEAEIAHHRMQLSVWAAQRERLDGEVRDHRRALEERTGHQESQTTALEERRVALSEEEQRSEELERAHAQSLEDLRRVEAELGRLQARRDALEGLLRRREGLVDGTRAILDKKDKHPEWLPGFRGLLLDLFEVEFDEARAVEAALGDAASAIVVADAEEALQALSFLREKGLGGALLLPLDRFPAAPKADLNGIRPSDDAIRNVLAALVGGIQVVDRATFEKKMKSGKTLPPLLVSSEGELLREGRIVSTPRGGETSPGLVVLSAEMKDLDRRLPKARAGRDQAKDRVLDALKERDGSRARVRELSVALVKEEGDAARLDQEIVRLLRELERFNAETDRLSDEGNRTKTSAASAQELLYETKQARGGLEEERQRAQRDVDVHQTRLSEHAQELERALQALETARLEEAKLVARVESLKSRESYVGSSISETDRRIVQDQKAIFDMETAIRDADSRLDEGRQHLKALTVEAQGVRAHLKDREGAADTVRDRLREVAGTLDEIESSFSGSAEALASARGREGELRAALQALAERTRDEIGVELDQLIAEEDLAIAAEASLEVVDPEVTEVISETVNGEVPQGEVPPEEIVEAVPAPSAPIPTDWSVIEAEIRELKDRIIRLGNVNHAAIEELAEAEKRAEFITRERNDLERSREQLREVLKSIEVQSTELFLTTFHRVREHFTTIFRRLFGGGKADMILENEAEPLESGIEIKARPPGKELRSITLLSGGERSMTAVALLFAIFKAHPAPCAFLDEVDAALDEDNTERFVRMVEDSRGESQFVVVTHSKRTMEHADLLYGVTMPERGVSRRVAVRIEQLDDKGQLSDIDAVNRAAAAAPQEVVLATPPTEPKVEDRIPPLEVPAYARRARSKKMKSAPSDGADRAGAEASAD